MKLRRIGIYAGTFDPVHSGHISFALQAIEAAKLDLIYFMPERKPRAKSDAEHYGHRVAMIKKATIPHSKIKVLEMVEMQFSVSKTMPKLIKQFDNDQMVFMFGSDVVASIEKWPNAPQLIHDNEFVIGLRNNDMREDIKEIISTWKVKPKSVIIFDSFAPHVSSGKVRLALQKNTQTQGLLKSVEKYSGNNWLYINLADVDTA